VIEKPQAYSISEIVKEIKSSLEGEFFNITIQGEVTNLSYSSAGHIYFTLSDDQAALSCALFRGDALRNPMIRKVNEGDKLIVSGSISVYLKRGTFQLIAKKLSFFGKGDLKAQFEQLKLKLGQEGLFDIEVKKEIPKFPKKIAIITAPGGAALQDFLNIMKRRAFDFHITIVGSLMQGDKCAASVVQALNKIQKVGDFDVVVITRGGGAIEDLWGFNDEKLVRKIFEFSIPVISAIGHQTDYTLCDYVSDMRCETPSSAAEVLSSPQVEIQRQLNTIGRRLKSAALEVKSQLSHLMVNLNPKNSISHLKELFSDYKYRLKSASLVDKIDAIGLNQYHQELDDLQERMLRAIVKKEQGEREKIHLFKAVLDNISPYRVLARGYTMITTEENQVLTSSKNFDKLESDTSLSVHFKDGVREVFKKD
tara:strand:- start:15683 stop:16954 length:1272 start_codon:yes stop_codon:yes gene_type:complete